MKIKSYIAVILFFNSFLVFAQKDSIQIKSLKDYPEEKIQTDAEGQRYYYDQAQKARIYEVKGETVVVLDEMVLLNRPKFNNDLDKNYYAFLNKRLSRVYPLFLTALEQYRALNEEFSGVENKSEKRKLVKKKQEELAVEYEKKLKDLTTSEGRVFAKLMHRATGKTVYEIIKELRGGWSAFWWNVKGGVADIDIKQPYNPKEDRTDQFIENLLQSSWNYGYLQPYEGYLDFGKK